MEEIIALEKRRIEAMTNQDAKALGEILADDLSYTHSSGRVETKAEFIANATSGGSRYRALSQEDMKVRQYGDTAIVTGSFMWSPAAATISFRSGSSMSTSSGTMRGVWSRGSPRNSRNKRDDPAIS